MIVNIPVSIDDELFNKVTAQEFEAKLFKKLYEKTEKAVSDLDRDHYYGKTVESGLMAIAKDAAESVIKENKDLIIEKAAEHLANKLAKTKAGKALLEGMKENVD